MGWLLNALRWSFHRIACSLSTVVITLCCSFVYAQIPPNELAVSRRAEDGALIKYSITLDGLKSDSKALLVILPANLRPTPSTSLASTHDAPNTALTEPAHYPITRSRTRLLEAGFALAWLVMPANAGILGNVTIDPRFLSDMEDVLASLKRQYPQMQRISVGTEGLAMASAMLAMRGSKSVDGQLILSPFWQRIREEKLEQGNSANALIVHDSSNQCYLASLIETKEYLQRTGWKSVAYQGEKASDIGVCGAGSTYLLPGIDMHLPSLLQDWLQKKSLPPTAGATTTVAGLKERVIMATGKQGKLEITLLLPPAPGPHPVVIFNHGDMEMSFPWVKYRQRFVDIQVATTLLRQGYAVAIPARPGVGRSEGTYRYSQYAIHDGDPSYKARTHAVAVMDAIAALRQEGDLDMKRFVLAGQSAGGDTVMYMATQAIDGLKGVINYAGGRSNHADGQSPTFENKMMISGWAELGAQAKVPAQLVFAENDSRYTANTIRKSYEAFNAAGGKAQLLLVPPLAGDGHFINGQPNIWRKAVLDFLGEVLK